METTANAAPAAMGAPSGTGAGAGQPLALPPFTGPPSHHHNYHHEQQQTPLLAGFLSPSACQAIHPAERLYWANVANIEDVAPERDATGRGGRYWPCLVYGSYMELIREVDKKHRPLAHSLHQAYRQQNGAPPRPIIVVLGIEPQIKGIFAVPDHISSIEQAENAGIVVDYFVGYDNYNPFRGFATPEDLAEAKRRGYDYMHPSMGVNAYDDALLMADEISAHQANLVNANAGRVDSGTVFKNIPSSLHTTQALPVLPPSTTAMAAPASAGATTAGSVAGGMLVVPGTAPPPHGTNHFIAAVSTTNCRGPSAQHHSGAQPFVSPVPFALPRSTGPSEQQASDLAALMGDSVQGLKGADASAQQTSQSGPGRVSVSTQDGQGAGLAKQDQGNESSSSDSSDSESESESEGEKKESSKTTATPATKAKAKENGSPPDNKESPIQRKDSWKIVWPKLKKSGWTYKPPTGLEPDWTYFRPGKQGMNDIVEGVDFFPSERAVKEYIRDNYGWRGEEGDLKEAEDLTSLERSNRRTRGRQTSAVIGESKSTAKKKKKVAKRKGRAKSTGTGKKNKAASTTAVTPARKGDSIPPEIRGTPIAPSDEWLIVWSKLEYTGWYCKYGSGLMTDYYYILPGRDIKEGFIEGVDYFTSEQDVRNYCEKTYGWDPQGATKEREEKEARELAAEEKAKAKQAKKEAKRKAKEAAAKAKRKAKEEADAEEASKIAKTTSDTGSPRRSPRNKAGRQTKQAARLKEKDLDQFYEEPGKRITRSSPGRVWGQEASRRGDNDSAVASTPSNKTKPQDPAKPRIDSESPVADRSLTPDHQDFYNFTLLWPRLQQAGWTHQHGVGRLSNTIYVRPQRNPRNEGSKLGVDYFDSQDSVIAYCKEADIREGEVGVMAAAAQAGKKRGSPAKIMEQSAVTGDFDMEAMKSPSMAQSGNNESKRRKVESIWWRTHPVPTSKTAWKILFKKLKYRYTPGAYRLPRKTGEAPRQLSQPFEDLELLRAHLCENGIAGINSSELTDDERDTLKRWVSTTYTPQGITDEDSIDTLSSVDIFTDTDAWALLEFQLDWSKETLSSGETRYYKPGNDATSSDKLEYFNSLGEVQDYLRANGPFDKKRYNIKWNDLNTPFKGKDRECPLPQKPYLALTFWAARSLLPVHPDDVVEQVNAEESSPKQNKSSTDSPSSPAKESGSNQNKSTADSPSSPAESLASVSSADSEFGCYEPDSNNSEKDALPGIKNDMDPVQHPSTPERKEVLIRSSKMMMQDLKSHSPVKTSGSWSQFWFKMQETGWEYRSEDGIDSKEVYLVPGAKSPNNGGKRGVDFFTSENEVKEYAKEHLKWSGDGNEISEETSAVKESLPTTNAMETPGLDYKQSLINKAKKLMREIRGSPIQRHDNWLNVVEKLKFTGWKQPRGPRIAGGLGPDFVWLFPGGKKPTQGGKPGIDFLMTEEDVKKFAEDHFNWGGSFDGIAE